MKRLFSGIVCAVIAAISAAPLHAQGDAAARTALPDTLRLGALQQQALQHDRRAPQLELLASQSALRMRNINTGNLPALGAMAQGQYQSDIMALPSPTGGVTQLDKDTYDAYLTVRQSLYNPATHVQRAVERARFAESQARVQTALYPVRQAVAEAYFAALLLQSQRAELQSGLSALEAQWRAADVRVREGASLRSEALALQAEMLRRRQALEDLGAKQGAALELLEDLTKQPIRSNRTDTASIALGVVLALPHMDDAVRAYREATDFGSDRPEYQQFAATRASLESQQDEASARLKPRVSAFGRAGYARPGLNPMNQTFKTYWLTGVQVEWAPWNWGATRREREVLALQQEIVATEERAFTDQVRRSMINQFATIDRLQQALIEDDTLVALREQILKEVQLRFTEGVITAAEYVDRESELLSARLARATHRVELAQAQANILTLAGMEIR